MKKLRLYGRVGVVGYALVDDDDFKRLSRHRWNLTKGGYAYRRKSGTREMRYLHRVVMGLKKGDGLQVDHMNRDRLDCRKCNLRVVTHAQQGHNILRRGNFSSSYRGVSWDKRTGRWAAYVHCNYKTYHAGRFDDEQEAALAAKNLRRELLSHALD